MYRKLNNVNEFIFADGAIVHVLQHKASQNSKIGEGFVIQTTHLGVEQIEKIDLTLDNASCLDCPLSHRANGGCYTHKGNQRNGLYSMLKSKNKLNIPTFDQSQFDLFLNSVKKVDLVRFGTYGEPVLLPENIGDALISKSVDKKYTAYTHQWRKGNSHFAMASVHSIKQAKEAIEMGYRCFLTMPKKKYNSLDVVDLLWIKRNLIGCPAAKESKYDKTCIECGLCNGINGNKNGVFILMH
tara:strand:- start:247 stop:969 length:723 start_codon:yes stop_codon:yes gene_type:complete